MKISSIIAAILVCVATFFLIMKRDFVMELARGTAQEQRSAQEEALKIAEEEAAIALSEFEAARAKRDAANAAVENAKSALETKTDTPATQTSGKISVLAMKSTAQDVTSGILLRGETTAFKFVEVKSETSGTVVSQPLRKGTLVEQGELLCELDPGTKASALAEAQARLAEAQNNSKTSEDLVKKGFASETQVISRKAALEAAQAAVIRAQDDIAHLQITAPFSGLLESDAAEFGDLLQAGSTCATVIALDPIKLTGYATEQQVAKIAVGAPALASLITGEQVQGQVTYISRSADQITRTFLVETTVPNPLLKMRDGSTADIYIGLDGTKGHLLPQSAMTLDGDGRFGIRAAVDGRAQFMPVQMIRDTPDGIWVTGLPENIDVIVLGHEYVVTGTPVEVTYKGDKS
ncbi:hypothetical protein BFP76_03900 [Amylibacter kogurei]|uniref:Uncharacterized protein n=1 Tax=Paramylibacter kogurei TaxID=1889778 RepID=A0A2G5K492_9RHOB|nr:efflux RND transporter periplasmic adaptor subunit [Amylibacter kogurei]PIB24367.1 hypothetical protein BFP76_03900 [Amylibacter kogurei]